MGFTLDQDTQVDHWIKRPESPETGFREQPLAGIWLTLRVGLETFCPIGINFHKIREKFTGLSGS